MHDYRIQLVFSWHRWLLLTAELNSVDACYWNLSARKAHTLVSWRLVALSQDVFLTLLQMLQQHWLGSTVAKSVPVSWNCVWLLSEAPAVTGTCPSSQALAFAGCMPNPLWIQPASQWRMPPREKKHHHHPGASWALLMSSSLVKKEGIGWIGMFLSINLDISWLPTCNDIQIDIDI